MSVGGPLPKIARAVPGPAASSWFPGWSPGLAMAEGPRKRKLVDELARGKAMGEILRTP